MRRPPESDPIGATSLLVRVSVDRAGRLRGTVQRLRTGQKEHFRGRLGLGRAVAQLARAAGLWRPAKVGK
jgi:hypothetical protein